ncbi:MAG: porin, partial [Gemmatimonadaceae bacterium]|nr:porin [Gemmatimonadaceae bacterium]
MSPFEALCLTTVTHAQTNNLFYGRANLSVESQKDGNTSTTKMVDNSSRLGFKADRSIAGGFKAGVVLEAGTNLTT